MQTKVCIRFFFFFQAEDGIRDATVTGVQTCALPISSRSAWSSASCRRPWSDTRSFSGTSRREGVRLDLDDSKLLEERGGQFLVALDLQRPVRHHVGEPVA